MNDIFSSIEEQTIRTYDRYAGSWASEHSDRSEYKEIISQFRRLLPNGSVLEIGAGGGSDAKLLSDAGYAYTGTDASEGMVAEARRACPNLTFEQLSVYELDRLGKQYDGFWACAVLLHIPLQRIDEALGSINRVLLPGGAGFISVKDGDGEVVERRRKSGRQEDRLFTYWSKDAFSDVLLRNGFVVTSYQYAPKSERTRWHRFFVSKQREA